MPFFSGRNFWGSATKLADGFEAQLEAMRELVIASGNIFERGPIQLIGEAEWNKKTVKAGDGYHWNELGHGLVGRGLRGRVALELGL